MALIDLIRPRSREQVVQRMLLTLSAGRGLEPNTFTLTNYVPGDPLRTLLEIAGEGISDAERSITLLGESGYLATASGTGLTSLVESHYGLTRQGSTFAQGVARFGAAAAGSAINLPAGMIIGTADGLKYTSREAVLIPPGNTVDVPVQAEGPGTAYNVLPSTITLLHTPLPGLTVTNPPGWLTQAGADEETDAALRSRAALRWSELGGGATRRAYEYWALSAHPAVDRVRVLDDHPRGQGTVDVVIWGPGGVGSEAVTAVNTYIQERRPLTSDVLVYAADERVVPITLELYAPGGDRPSIEARIITDLAALVRSRSIGQTLYRAQIIEVAMLPPAMLDVQVSTPDLVQGPIQALTLVPTLTWRDT
ncbi:baseplate J/gp47 family protein [Deinococcus sp. 6GRE01]|uniref:baseplate J/gp47 family protein n=1 Tax=Deinococcus sp. 6GRE01 TaxID=2745873 RepID=UPI001E56D3EE|nr:baseplate J/gp47 family protein [Deinococcus sp. 6GRE01]MCD0156004.1 baseplate J/gp47 family protein [Deinococcus sp. 6GRE01]